VAFRHFEDGDSRCARRWRFVTQRTSQWKTPRKFNQFAFEWQGIAISVTGWLSHKDDGEKAGSTHSIDGFGVWMLSGDSGAAR